MILNKQASDELAALIAKGWQVCMAYDDHSSYFGKEEIERKVPKYCWDVAFTRKLKKPLKEDYGLYDNHKSGFSADLSEAILLAVNYVKLGIRHGD